MVKLPTDLAARFVLNGVTSPREVLRNGQEVDWRTIDEATALHIVEHNLSSSIELAPPVATEKPAKNPPKDK